MALLEQLLQHADKLAQIGGMGLLVIILLWDKISQAKRNDKSARYQAEKDAKINERIDQNMRDHTKVMAELTKTMSDLSASLRYNLFCPLLNKQQTLEDGREPVCKNQSEPH